MPLLSPVASRSVRGRLVHAGLFAVLGLGGITMIYPFLLMIAGSLRSEMDAADLGLVPSYLVHDDDLYRKFLEAKYNHDVGLLNGAHRRGNFSFRAAALPLEAPPGSRAAADLAQFLADQPPPAHWQRLGQVGGQVTAGPVLWMLRDRLQERFHGDLGAFTRDTGIPAQSWKTILAPVMNWLGPDFDPPDHAVAREYFALLAAQPLAERPLLSVTQHCLETLVFPVCGRTSCAAFAAAYPELGLTTYDDFVLPATAPPLTSASRGEGFRGLWRQFVYQELNASFVLLDGVRPEAYRAHLEAKYQTIAGLNAAWHAKLPAFAAIDLPRGQWRAGPERRDYLEFVRTQPLEALRLTGPEYAWRAWLARHYASVAALNAAHGTRYASIAAARLPLDQYEQEYVHAHARAIRWASATWNFRLVLRELLGHGGALVNTLIVCGSLVVLTLLVNPLAAYGLSRFRLPGTYKVLLLLMVTMAFPPMVTAIPTFILMRKLDLLNSFAALVLPFVASGYQIFLLKGFFDSLPRELYESATIDGASEWRVFWTITMALSKPILAVVALGAFTQGYTMFLFPLIVCPREDLWTINVWLYQWQYHADAPSVFAALLIGCVPTLLVFVLAQGVIMRGIVVPVEK